jgi:hypothetical protein
MGTASGVLVFFDWRSISHSRQIQANRSLLLGELEIFASRHDLINKPCLIKTVIGGNIPGQVQRFVTFSA